MKLHNFYSYFFAIKEMKLSGCILKKGGWISNSEISFFSFGLYFLPIFKEVRSSFYCYYNSLETLRGLPEIIQGNLDISSNNLKTLDGISKVIKYNFYCFGNKIKKSEFEKISSVQKIYTDRRIYVPTVKNNKTYYKILQKQYQ